jgi:FlaA1/EpsC-like NDP-sugar epimerase
VFTGLRPGEKLEETLFGAEERAIETDSPFLLLARTDTEGVTYDREAACRLERLAEQGADDEVRRELEAVHDSSAG